MSLKQQGFGGSAINRALRTASYGGDAFDVGRSLGLPERHPTTQKVASGQELGPSDAMNSLFPSWQNKW